MGHKVVEAGPAFDYERYLAAQKVIWAASTAQSLDALAGLLRRPVEESGLQQTTLAVYRHGHTLNAASLIAAIAVYDKITRVVGEFLAVHDVLVTPTCAISPELLGTYNPDRPGRSIDTVFADMAPKETFSALFNGTGSPAISLPLGWTQNGLPIGVQFVAAFGRDDLLLRLGAVLEAEYAWHHRKPSAHITQDCLN